MEPEGGERKRESESTKERAQERDDHREGGKAQITIMMIAWRRSRCCSATVCPKWRQPISARGPLFAALFNPCQVLACDAGCCFAFRGWGGHGRGKGCGVNRGREGG
jgi:hypothetical protein